MTLSIGQTRQAIRSVFSDGFVQTAIEGPVPSATELVRVNGVLAPYLVYNFSDLGGGRQTSVVGPRGDDYFQAFNVYSIAPTIKAAGDLNMKVLDKFLGFSPPYSGQVAKRPGGGAFTIASDNGATQAYIVVASFQFPTQLIDLP